MEPIFQTAVFNDIKLKNYITKITVNELNYLTESCKFPSWKNYYVELLNMTNLTEQDIRNFTKRFYSKSKIQLNLSKYEEKKDNVPLLLKDVGSNFLIILMCYFLKKNDVKTYSTIMIFYMIRQYGNVLHRFFPKYCLSEVFAYTLDNLNPTHLFIREKSIPNAILHLANAMKRRFTDGFIEENPDKISQFIFASRTNIFQSVKSFAIAYHKFEKEGKSIQKPFESEEGEEVPSEKLERGQRVSDLVSKKVCVYKEIDYKALDHARSLTKINSSLAILMVKELHKMDFLNDVKFIIDLFLKDVKSVKEICDKNFFDYLRRLIGIRRTTKVVSFKKEINILTLKILKNIKYMEKYSQLTKQTQFQINTFIAFYITIYTRNVIC